MDNDHLDLLGVEQDARDDRKMTDCAERTGHANVEWHDTYLDGEPGPRFARHEGGCVECGAAVTGYTRDGREDPSEWS